MEYLPTGLAGALLLRPGRSEDARGYFTRTWCRRELAAQGISSDFPQGNLSLTRRKGTIRGLHFQLPPSREAKLVRCSRGELFDVIVDLRIDSQTYLQHHTVNLSAMNGLSLYIPVGMAHGFQTLCDDTEAVYAMGDYYDPALSSGVRWNDPAFGIAWPLGEPTEISDRDRSYPAFQPAEFTAFRGC